jgi:YVTN family beta-propeller protein
MSRALRIFALLGAPLLAAAQPVAQTVATGQQPMAIAVNENTHKAYIANHNSSSVTVIDGRTKSVVATVKSGSAPEGIAVNPVTNRVYVACPGDGSVIVIDGAIDTAIATVKAGSYPQALAVNPATNKIYVANNYAHSVTVIDGATNAATTIRVGQGPRGVTAIPATNKIYTANYGSKDATEIDGPTNAAVSVPTGKHPWAIASDPRSNHVYVVNEDSASISIVDDAGRTARSVPVGKIPFAIAVNPEMGRVYALTYASPSMVAIDGIAGTVIKTLPLATRPSAIAVNPKTNRIYIANQTTASVLEVDGATNTVAGTVKTGTLPYAMAVDSAANLVYVANYSDASVTIIEGSSATGPVKPKFRVVALAERASGDHQSFVDTARQYLDRWAVENGFTVDYITGTERLNEKTISQYQLFIQLNYPPYRWAPVAQKAFEDYISQGKGGWIGFHHASLLGEFDGYPMDPWFSQFLGGIRFTSYIPDFAKATVKIEDPAHPLAKGLPSSFVIEKEEWYTWSQSPRPNVHVLATVDESSYVPERSIRMGGDHPVIWSNPHVKARNVYIFMGHHGGLFDNPNFVQLFQNAVFWGAGQ